MSTSLLRSWRSSLTLVGLLSATPAGTLNGNIVSIAYPALMRAYRVPFDLVVWSGVTTAVGLAAFMPCGGRLGDLFGYRRIYLLGSAVFLAGCLLSVLPALPFWLLLVCRLVQGIGGSAVTPAVMAIMSRDFPREQRGQLIGLWALAGGIGTALGPALGGLLTAAFGWPAVFGAAIPVLVVGVSLGWLLLPPDPPRAAASLHDGLGVGLLTGSILSGIFAIQQVAQPATRPIALVAGVFGLVLAGLFILRERSTAQPFLDLSLFGVRGFVVTTLVAHVQMLTLGAIVALAPLYLISVRGLRPDAAGGLLVPLSVALLGSAFVGRWSDRTGARPLALVGTALIAIACLLAARWDAETPLGLVPIELGLAGLGMVLIQAPLATLVTQLMPPAQLGISTGFFNMVRFLGPVLGGALAGTVVGLVAGPRTTDATVQVAAALPTAFLLVAVIAAAGTLLSVWVPGRTAEPVRQPAARVPDPQPAHAA